MQREDIISDQAALWAVRTGDSGFADWADFTAWLEEDAGHARAYDAAVVAAEDAAAALRDADAAPAHAHELPEPANDELPHGRRWAMPALAAGLVAMLGMGGWHYRTAETVYATAPGETRQIALSDGTSVDLAGGSRLAVARYDARRARLEQGRALFHVTHDAADPFTLAAGSATLVDAGTTFDVALASHRLDVEVADGAVIVNPDSANIRLGAGERVTGRAGDWQRSRLAAAEVGAWRGGRIAFREASLPEIAAELSRASGLAFAAAPGSAPVALSGSIALDGLRADPASIGPLLGLSVHGEGGRWIIASP